MGLVRFRSDVARLPAVSSRIGHGASLFQDDQLPALDVLKRISDSGFKSKGMGQLIPAVSQWAEQRCGVRSPAWAGFGFAPRS